MSRTLLYPMTLSAKMLLSPVKVPALFGAPFNRDSQLEAGVHLHWALPDSMTAATLLPDKGTQSAVFPAVPDLWVVIRFNPGTTSSTPAAKRSWVAWVVDSVAQTATPLSKWTSPERDTSQVHTLAGVLPDATSVGHRGMGLWDSDPAKHPNGVATFDPAMAAYYPEARKRFGFYDSLSDLPNRNGKASYLVVGWYSSEKHDPIALATSTAQSVDHWHAALDLPAAALRPLATQVVSASSADPKAGGAVAPAQNWGMQPKLAKVAMPDAARLQSVQRLGMKLATARVATRSETMEKQFPAGDAASTVTPRILASGAPAASALNMQQAQWQRAPVSTSLIIAFETIVHGSVYNVPLGGSNVAPTPLTSNNVKLYPNVKRALAEIATKSGTGAQQDAMEMLFADLESQKGTTGGVVDMPGAAHAATFQSVPGTPRTYLRIDVEAAPVSNLPVARSFILNKEDTRGTSNIGQEVRSGYWPGIDARSTAQVRKSRATLIPGLKFQQRTTQHGPDDAAKKAFADAMLAAFQAAVQDAALQGLSVDTRRVRVQDSRSNARSLGLGQTTDNSGSDAAGWWIDVTQPEQWAALLVTTQDATVSELSPANTYAMPGPRWYRSWSPQVVLSDVGRTYKFGYDTRFRADRKVEVRLSGNTVSRITVGQYGAVAGADILGSTQMLAHAALPSTILSLATESVLFDPESSGSMAAVVSGAASPSRLNPVLSSDVRPNPPRAKAQADFGSAIQALWFARDSAFDASALKSVQVLGQQPSPVAVTPWQEPFDPVFLDSNYSHLRSDLSNWKVNEGDADFSVVSASAVTGQPEVFHERSSVTATVVSVMQSALIGRTAIDPYGNNIPRNKPTAGLTDETFNTMDVVSAALTEFDPGLVKRDLRLRAGVLRLNSLELVDMFGMSRPWNGPEPESSVNVNISPNLTCLLPPRLPYWARYNFRLMSAADSSQEADTDSGPICGILLPDFFEHALEVFDGGGNGLGQLTSDPPVHGKTDAVTLTVTYTPHPWLEPNPDPLFHIKNGTLRSLVSSLMVQSIAVTGPFVDWKETGLSAMLRVIDTVRGTFSGAGVTTPDRKISLLGKPILVMSGRVAFQGAATENTADLSGDPPQLSEPPAMPALEVRIGDASRPDDGVLGLFVAGATAQDGRFAPVTTEAASKALLNTLSSVNNKGYFPASHPFIQGESVVSVPPGTPVDVTILADADQALYATCGVLPRKRIAIPRDFVDAAVKHLQPSFYAGPVLVSEEFQSEKILLPAPDVTGYEAQFYYRAEDGSGFTNSDLPPSPPLGDLPKSRVMLSEGWLRMTPVGDSKGSGV